MAATVQGDQPRHRPPPLARHGARCTNGCTQTSLRCPMNPTVADSCRPNRLILRGPAGAVTAEAAGSSPVVPAIHSKRVERISQPATRVQKGAFLHPFCTPFLQLKPVSRLPLARFLRAYISAVKWVSEVNTSSSTAACAACLAGEIACVYSPRLNVTKNDAAVLAS